MGRKNKNKIRRQIRKKKQKKGRLQMSDNKGNREVTPLNDAELEEMIKKHDQGGAFKNASPMGGAGCWDSGIKIRKGCAQIEKPSFHVNFETLADQKIKALQAYYPSLEWLAYLVGEIDYDKGTVLVTDLVIPDSQQVTGVNVYNVEYEWGDDIPIIGVIHSHHGMGAFFSGTDDAYINQNHDVSIVVSTNKTSPIKGQVRVKVPCNDYVLAENITFDVVETESEFDKAAFEAEFTDKINKYTYVYKPISFGGFGNFGRGLFGGGYGRGNNVIDFRRGNSGFVEDDPYAEEVEDMSVEELRAELQKFYSPEEAEEFITNGGAQEELVILKNLMDDITVDEAVVVDTDGNIIDDDDSIWEELDADLEAQGFTLITPEVMNEDDDVLELEESEIEVEVDPNQMDLEFVGPVKPEDSTDNKTVAGDTVH